VRGSELKVPIQYRMKILKSLISKLLVQHSRYARLLIPSYVPGEVNQGFWFRIRDERCYAFLGVYVGFNSVGFHMNPGV
jgi:hypothetical protein